MLRTSFAVAIAMVLGVVVAVLVTTRDLNTTNNIFTDGVIQAQKVNATTDIALTAGNELVPAQETFGISIPQTLSVIAELKKAQATLDGLGTQLTRAAAVLISAQAPLIFIIGEVITSFTNAEAVGPPFSNINNLLEQGNGQVGVISNQLTETTRLAREIESKLRAAGNLGQALGVIP